MCIHIHTIYIYIYYTSWIYHISKIAWEISVFCLHVSGEIKHEVGIILGLHIERRWFHFCIDVLRESKKLLKIEVIKEVSTEHVFRFTGKTTVISIIYAIYTDIKPIEHMSELDDTFI